MSKAESIETKSLIFDRHEVSKVTTLILFYKQPLFLAEPGRAYENPKYEPQACLGPCLVNYKFYTYT